MRKKLCVLQVTPEEPTQDHIDLFHDKKDCDFFFVTHDKAHPESLKFCPKTTWVDTRNVLAKMVPKNYDYYAFVDYDYVLRPQTNLNALEQILEDLRDFNPAVLTYYPGKGLHTPFATDTKYFQTHNHSVIPFTHCGLKIVHHSLMDWFFPMVTRFGGGVDACHLFNILEIPFLKNVVCSHKMLYDNGVTDLNTPHNQNGAWSKYRMDEMWKWIQPSFKKNEFLKTQAKSQSQLQNSLFVKEVFVSLMKSKLVQPTKADTNDFLDVNKISKFFDLSHERFANLNTKLEDRPEIYSEDDLKIINTYLSKINFEDLVTTTDPWDSIIEKINDDSDLKYKITTSECVDLYQKSNPQSLFINSNKKNEELNNYLKGKRVAIVGPAPYLKGQGKGSLIDSYDVVVRIQHDILDMKDFGSRTDIVQSCLNSNYGPPLVEHLKTLSKDKKPKFIISNDTVSHQKRDGTWVYIDEAYENIFRDLDIPLVHLKNGDGSWNRWPLYWEVYSKKHIERFPDNNFTIYSANFNSGYGSLNFLLSYDIKELAVFGLDFYNTGIPQTCEEKYNEAYTKAYGTDGRPMGPDKVLHDQLSQIMHCKNVLMKDERFKMDPDVLEKLNKNSMNERIKSFLKLPKFKKDTR
jgi:hypothetical protein